jgi:hypothetical protein
MQTYKEEDFGHALVVNVDEKRVVWVCVSSGIDGKVLQW